MRNLIQQLSRFKTQLGVGALWLLGSTAFVAHAQSNQTNEVNTAGVQCITTAVNDNGGTVGGCVESQDARDQAFYASPGATAQTVLNPVNTGDSCKANGIDYPALLGLASLSPVRIFGECKDENGDGYAVTWDVNGTPTALPPLTGAAAETSVTGFDANGDAIGNNYTYDTASNNAGGVSTPVIWPINSTQATALPTPTGAACAAIDVTNNPIELLGLGVESQPVVALNCSAVLNADGSIVSSQGAYVATGSVSLLGVAPTFQLKQLPIGDSAYCDVSGVNTQLEFVGTCYDATGNASAAYWASSSAAPILVTAPGATSTAPVSSYGLFINASGNIAFSFADTRGIAQSGIWLNPATSAATVAEIPDLTGGSTTELKGFGNNNIATFNGDVASGNMQGALWEIGDNSVTPLTDGSGGDQAVSTAMSPNGIFTGIDETDTNNLTNAATVQITQ